MSRLTEITITIPGEPVAQGRGRIAQIPLKGGGTAARIMDPSKSRNWKATAQQLMVDAIRRLAPDWPGCFAQAGEPVELLLGAYFSCPTSDYRTREPRPCRWHLKRGDIDNIQKAVLDAGNGVLWMDDSQVARVVAEKIVAAQNTPARVVIKARLLPDYERFFAGREEIN